MTELKNTYVLMRHGKSVANEEGIILSHPDRGVPGYGLVAEGKVGAKDSARQAKAAGTLSADTIIVSSDFARAAETAEIVADVLGVPYVTLTPKLRERFFGVFDGTSNANYEKVWAEDHHDPSHTRNGVESARATLARVQSLISDLEKQYSGKTILLVSHGDTLQILQTAFEQVGPGTHRTLAHLELAEVRKVN